MTLQRFLENRINELQLLLDDQLHRHGGKALNLRSYRNIEELLRENKRLLAVLRNELPTGGRIQ